MAAGQGEHYGRWGGEAQIAWEATFGTAGTSGTGLILLEEPSIDMGYPEQIDGGAYGRGTSERFAEESTPGIQTPSLKFAFQPNEAALLYCFWSLLQGGVIKTGAGPFTYTGTAYTDMNPAAMKGFTFWKIFQAGATTGALRCAGCVTKSLKLSSTQGGILRCEVEAIPYAATPITAPATQTSQLTGNKRYAHYDSVPKIAAVGGTPAAFSPTVYAQELTITNNAEYFHGTSQTPASIVLGELGVTGSLGVTARGAGLTTYFPNAFGATGQKYSVEFGTAAAAGFIQFIFDLEWGKLSDQAQNNIAMLTLPFKYGKAAASGSAYTSSIVSSTSIT